MVALFGREDGELLVGGDEDTLESLGARRAAVAFGVEIRDGVAPGTSCVLISIIAGWEVCFSLCENSRIKDTRSLATIVGHEDHVVHLLRASVVVGDAIPVEARRLALGLANVLDGVGDALHRGRGGRHGRSGGGGRGGGSLGLGAVVDLFPRDDVAVDGGGDPLGALLLDELVEVLVAARVGFLEGGGDVALLLVVGGEVVDGDFFDVDWAADVEREL